MWAVSGSPPKSQYSDPRPIKPNEATQRPITDPPKNATLRAAGAPAVCAAVVVRTLARVAAYIPMYPARAEEMAPTANAKAVCHGRNTANSTSRIAAKIPSIWYSRRMNTMAPRWIWSAICFTASVPSAKRRTMR